jgi:hypothetical protein
MLVRLFGVTTLDVIRAQTFASEVIGQPHDAPNFRIPVIGGHSGVTIVPLLSQAQPSLSLDQQQIDQLTNRIQFGGDEVVKAKDGGGSATLSMAAAGYRFVDSLLAAKWGGKSNVVEMACTSLWSPSFAQMMPLRRCCHASGSAGRRRDLCRNRCRPRVFQRSGTAWSKPYRNPPDCLNDCTVRWRRQIAPPWIFVGC